MTLIELIEKEIADNLAAESDNVAYGGAEDYAQYREHVGRVKGLAWVQNLIKEKKRIAEED